MTLQAVLNLGLITFDGTFASGACSPHIWSPALKNCFQLELMKLSRHATGGSLVSHFPRMKRNAG